MSVSPSPHTVLAIVAKLRGAGCVFAEDEAQLLISAARTPADLTVMVDRRVAGLPLEHILGWVDFCGLRVALDAGVFVPRRRTEFLAHEATALARETLARSGELGSDGPPVVVDLCCGSGAVGAVLASALDCLELYASDIEPAAVACARRNLESVGGQVYQGNLFEALPRTLRGRIDVLVANVPYVPSKAIAMMPVEARIHEPLVALDGGPDGFDVLRRVTASAVSWLAPGGHLLVEVSERQAGEALDIFEGDGLAVRLATCDELDATVVIGTRSSVQDGHTLERIVQSGQHR